MKDRIRIAVRHLEAARKTLAREAPAAVATREESLLGSAGQKLAALQVSLSTLADRLEADEARVP